MRQFIVAAVLGVLLCSPLSAQEERTLTVTGEGQVAAVPDMAAVRIGVTTDAGTAAEALASNSTAMDRVMARLTEAGVGERDLQTSTLSLGPRYADRSEGQPVVAGYEARNILTVRVRELDRLGEILDAAASDGANTFEGLSFGMAESEALQDEAMRLAVADARRRAELLAAEAGVTLAEVLTIDAGGTSVPRPADMAMSRMAAEAVPVARGELEISATVRVVFAIE